MSLRVVTAPAGAAPPREMQNEEPRDQAPPQPDDDPRLRGVLERLQRRSHRLAEAGRFTAAIALCERGTKLARARNDRAGADFMRCNLAGILVAHDRGHEISSELKRLLIGSTSTTNSFLAAYNLSCYYDREEDTERAHRYARQALDLARRSARSDFLAQAHNQHANLLVLDSQFGEAGESYATALEHLPETVSVARALVLSNLGYCRVVQNELPSAFSLLFAGLRMLRRLGADAWEVASRVRLSLCLAYLELGRTDRARHHGEVALAAAETWGDRQAAKHSLYLLGEVEKTDGSEIAAFSHFCRLQREFYPDCPGVTDTLMVTDTHKLINLMA